jgi:hypothetical protein
MQKYIKIVDEKNKIVQVTTTGERWYGFLETSDSGLPTYQYVPSVTWILNYYPKGAEFTKWVASQGYEEAEKLKTEAGDKGSIVHNACELLMKNGTIKIDELVPDRDGIPRQLTVDEYYCVLTFARWYASAKPVIKGVEMTVRSVKHGYAGTLDILCEIDGKLGIIDLKTSKSIYASHELQVSALKQAFTEQANLPIEWIAILQVGYTRNKDGYKFTLINDDFESFLATRRIWERENGDEKPHQRDYPMEILLPVEEPQNETK